MLAILIPTYEDYKHHALETCKRIEKQWNNPPEVYFSGATGSDSRWLECSNSRANWVDSIEEALVQLEVKGITQIYLILDDHPPIRKCHSRHLNETIPTFMKQMDATTICLRGVGQSTKVPSAHGQWWKPIQRLRPNYCFMFSLHPALWNLSRLLEIIRKLKASDYRSTNAWLFELNTPKLQTIPQQWKIGTYQVCGGRMSCQPYLIWIIKSLKITLRILHLHQKPIFEHLWQYYEGPYPLIFGGTMVKGKENRFYHNHLKLFRNLIKELEGNP